IEIDPAAVRAAQPQPEMPPLPSREHLAVLAARDSLAGASSPEWEHVAREWAAYTGRRAAGETVSFGLAMSGVPQGSVLWADRVDVRLIDAGGRVVFEGTGDELEVHSDGDRVHARQSVLVPTDVY